MTTETTAAPDVSRAAIERLTRDLRAGAKALTIPEARFLVDAYYTMQDNRIHAANQVRALAEAGEPNEVLGWFMEQGLALEREVAKALDAFSAADPVGRWARSVKGIGPVLAAGLLAHLSVNPWRCRRDDPGEKPCREGAPCTERCGRQRTRSVGHWWRFAGLDPTSTWGKGERRPWNARLKVLCWKIGESFVKVSGQPDAFYGRVYRERKELEERRNAAGEFAGQAAATLAAKRIGADTDAYRAYSQGRLPQARLHLRAQRYAVKLFLAHLHEVMYRREFGEAPPAPYPIAHLGHSDKIEPPGAAGED